MVRTASSAPGLRRIGDPRDIEIVNYEVEKEGVVKFKPIYEALHIWLTEHGFSHPVTGDDVIEDLYWERWVPAGHKEQHIWWRVKKDVNEYIRYYFEINYQTLLGSPSEVAYKGKKVKGEFIDFIVRVRGYLQFDINNKFQDSIAWKLRKIFFDKIYKDEMNQHKTEVYNAGMEIQRLLKHMFEMQSDKDVPVNFNPQMGYKEP